MIDKIHIISNNLRSNQSQAESRSAEHLNEHSTLLQNVLSSQSGLHCLLQAQRQLDKSAQVLAPNAVPPIGDSSSNHAIYVKASRFQRVLCTSYCKCACHTIHVFRSPTLLDRVIGNLFIGYYGYYLPGTIQQCTQASCISQRMFQTYVHYIFPAWFFAKALMFELTTQSPGKISISLTIQRIVPSGSEVFRLARLNDVEGLKELFSKGLASPNDCNYFGITALWVSFLQPYSSSYPRSILGKEWT